MTLIGYDPDRVRTLHRLAIRTRDELDGVRSGDPAAASAMTTVRAVRNGLDDTCLALAGQALACEAMLTFTGLGTVPVVGALLGAVRHGGLVFSDTDLALVQLLRHFDLLDVDGNGEVSGLELQAGRNHPDADVRAASDHLLAYPLIMRNVAEAGGRYSYHEGSEDVDVAELALTPAAIATTVAQNEILRVLADPVRFAAMDRATNNEIDGRVSADDITNWLTHETDPDTRRALQLMLDNDFLGKLDRDHDGGTSDGTIAYDQVYALGTHQGAFTGLADPAIPAPLRDQFGPPEATGDRTAQFLHHLIEPQPGMGQVMIGLFINTGVAGAPGPHIGKSTGNDRGPDPHAHPSDSKGWAVVDYETGLVTVRVNPSCSASGDEVCHAPLPIITDFGSGAYLWQRTDFADSSNRASVTPHADRTDIRFGILNSDKLTIAPRLDARFEVRTHDDGTASMEWSRDDFPDLEAFHVYPDGRIVRLVHDHASQTISLLGWNRAHGTARG
ncbi:MAG: hypothetical protein ACR2HP_00885 [Ilumatobacteraceae bacterium]